MDPAADRTTVGDLLREGRRALEQAGIETPRLDAEVLLMHALGVDPAAPEAEARFLAAIARRAAGEPVAYITGTREFMGLPFQVDPRVLVPRPETEYLVEWGLERLRRRPARAVVDVGTGSGAVAVSLGHYAGPERARLIVGSDISRDALDVARANAERLAPGRVALVRGDLLAWCRDPVDLLLANLPYLRDEQAHAGIAHEPALALYAPEAGFALYRRLLAQASERLRPGGALICEIDPGQREVALATARERFPLGEARVERDLAGLDRYLIVELP